VRATAIRVRDRDTTTGAIELQPGSGEIVAE
jgi:hypothetical protein